MRSIVSRSLAASRAVASKQIRAVLTSAEQSGPKHDWFSHVDEAPKDPILGITEKFNADPNPNKINLGVGAYRDEHGQPVVLETVREAEAMISGTNEMEYLPISGHSGFIQSAIRLAYGDNASCLHDHRVAAIQSLSGTGACRIFSDLVQRYLPGSAVYLPDPTWANHHNILRDAGVDKKLYRYYKADTRGLDFDGMMQDLQAAGAGSVVLLHACAHNPTGVDPTMQQWKQLSDLMRDRELMPFFDMAYQGFASGDCDADAAALRLFVSEGHRVGLSQSFAKNMGLYGQRVGTLSIICDSTREAVAVESEMKAIARPMYSNPPLHGALLVHHTLSNSQLREHWFKEVKMMADRIIQMRSLLRKHLETGGSNQSWQHITDQIGMFCYSGLTPEQVDLLMRDHSIYMTLDGRISMAGVTPSNVKRLADAICVITEDDMR